METLFTGGAQRDSSLFQGLAYNSLHADPVRAQSAEAGERCQAACSPDEPLGLLWGNDERMNF